MGERGEATVKLLYFAWLRERVGRAEETVSLPRGIRTVAELVAWQKTRGPEFARAFANRGVVRAAIDREHATEGASIAGAREIAFFPPVTGG